MFACKFFFISLSVTFISVGSFYDVEVPNEFLELILITSAFNPASDRLLVSIVYLFIYLFFEFCSVLLFGPYFFVSLIWQPPCVCFCVSYRAALTPCLSGVAYGNKVYL